MMTLHEMGNDIVKIILVYCFTLVFIRNSEGAVWLNKDGGYSGISVALSPELKEIECFPLVKAIQEAFTSASTSLLVATSGLTFQSIRVVIPESWETCGLLQVNETSGILHWDNADFRVGPYHQIFGDEPWTKQPRGCGLPGDFVYLSDNWLFRKVDKGSRLIHEWAKYRWGIFEEYGHHEDKIYPESFATFNGSWMPNYCTNDILKGKFQKDCSLTSDCEFIIDSSNARINSSLMAVPELFSVNSFCNSTSHRSEIPSKQNVICARRSAYEILNMHKDSIVINNVKATGNPGTWNGIPVSVTIVKENKLPSVMVVFETSRPLSEIPNQFEFGKESISQFILYEAPSVARVGLISFGKYVKILSNLLQLDVSSRLFLSEKVLSTITEGETVDLLQAVLAAASTLGDNNGIIFLVTKCTKENPSYSAQELATAAAGHPVWVLLYPYVEPTYLTLFADLALSTGGEIQVVDRELTIEDENVLMSVNVRMKLSEAFRQILHFDQRYDFLQISHETCSQKSCRINMEVKAGYNSETNLYLYHSTTDIVSHVTDIAGGSCVLENFGEAEHGIRTTSVLKCHLLEGTDKLSLKINRQLAYGDLIAELIGRPKLGNTDYEIKLSSSSGSLYDLQYSEISAPVMLVEVLHKRNHILKANVSIQIHGQSPSRRLQLNDDGTGADVTGNDGVYSAFLVPVLAVGEFRFNVSASDNGGEARILVTDTGNSGNGGKPIRCCGSSIPIEDYLKPTNPFATEKDFVSARVTYSPSRLINLPPGQIKNLRVDIVRTKKSDKAHVVVTFTAPGADLDYGIASKYMVSILEGNEATPTSRLLNMAPGMSGTTEIAEVDLDACDRGFTMAVAAVDEVNQRGFQSNPVFVYVPCDYKKGSKEAGEIAGIIFGCSIIVIIIVFIIYLLMRRRKSDRGGRYTASKEGDQSLKETRVEHIRNIHELDSANRRNLIQDVYTGEEERLSEAETVKQSIGTSHQNLYNDDLQRTSTSAESLSASRPIYLDHHHSKASLHSLGSGPTSYSLTTMIPINQVGIPVGQTCTGKKSQYSRSLDNVTGEGVNLVVSAQKQLHV